MTLWIFCVFPRKAYNCVYTTVYIFMKDEIFHCSGPVATVLLRPTSSDVFATACTRVTRRYLYRSVTNVRLDDHSTGNSRLLVLVGRVAV